MNTIADMGGMHGFGPVAPDPDEPRFHAAWEKRALALTLAMGATGLWPLDRSRAVRESLPPADYLCLTYYGIWIAALERLVLASGLASPAELAAGTPTAPPVSIPRVLKGRDLAAALAKGSPTERSATTPARFAAGDRVTARPMSPPGHTRCPRYVRGRPGVVEAVRGVHVYPDSNAAGRGEDPRWLYTVRFAAADLWGPDTTADAVFVDLWEPYLEAAP